MLLIHFYNLGLGLISKSCGHATPAAMSAYKVVKSESVFLLTKTSKLQQCISRINFLDLRKQSTSPLIIVLFSIFKATSPSLFVAIVTSTACP
jgi:hypothetical protein